MHSIRTHLQKEITVTTINWGKPRINFKTYGSNITKKESLYGDKELTIQPESRKRNYSLTLFHTQYKPTSMFKVQTYQKLQGIKSARPSKLSPPEILLLPIPCFKFYWKVCTHGFYWNIMWHVRHQEPSHTWSPPTLLHPKTPSASGDLPIIKGNI